jgi:hypothetical protein
VSAPEHDIDAALDAFHAAVAAVDETEDWAAVVDNDRRNEEIEGDSRVIVTALLAAGWRAP